MQCCPAFVTRFLAEQLRHDKQLYDRDLVLFLLCCDEYQSLAEAQGGRLGVEDAAELTQALASWMTGEEAAPILFVSVAVCSDASIHEGQTWLIKSFACI